MNLNPATNTKVCSQCQDDLPASEFTKHKSTPDGLSAYCRACKAERSRQYRERNKDKISLHDKKYRVENLDKIKATKQKYYECNKDYIASKTLAYQKANPYKLTLYRKSARVRLRLEVLSAYCGEEIKCKFCDVKEIELLTVDHINGGGNQHIKEVKSLYSWIKRNGYPEGFQILCWNCQLRKKNQECKPKDPTYIQLQNAERRARIKHEALQQYGKICVCGVEDEVILTLDHVNDDGADHRREVGVKGSDFYYWLRRNDYPNEPPLQVLCANCQYRKRNGILLPKTGIA